MCWQRHGRDSPSRFLEGIHPANTLILDLQPPELGDSTFLSFKPLICGTLLQLPFQTNTMTITKLITEGNEYTTKNQSEKYDDM